MTDESIFATALQLQTADKRRAYLDQACAGNPALRAEVEALLQAEAGAGSFLNHPPVGADATIAMSAEHDTVDANHGPVSLAFLQPCETPGRIGKIDHYEVIEVVGQGGMGVVLRAFDTKLSRIVAVKVMAPELAANPQAVKRFKREASAAAAVHHDHVVTIHAVEDQHKPPFIVMQFIEGQTLQEKIDREGALGLKQILRIVSQMAAGLAAAHKLGLIHRDVKPANILLENGVERVKITDFGLARAADDLEMTQTGMIAGTPQYMSPEQAKGESIDARSDLFSLGSVLYTMCTGRPGFRAETTMGVLKRVCEETPRPIREVNAEIPPWLEAIVGKLLAKNPADRFQSAAEVAELLSQHLAHEQSPALVARPATIMHPPPAATQHAGSLPSTSHVGAIVLTLVALLVGLPLLVVALGVGAYFFSHSTTKVSPGIPGANLTVEVNDPRVEFTIDGRDPKLRGEMQHQIGLEDGQHRVWFKLDEVELNTAPFVLGSGERATLRLEVGPDRAWATLNGRPIGVELLAGSILNGGTIVLPGKVSWPPTAAELTAMSAGNQPWQPLFNGQELAGWQPHPAESTAWAVKDGVIEGRGTNSYLFSARGDYKDFWLRAEVKINAAGDGGLLVRMSSPTEPEVAKSGYEVQIAGDPNHVSPTASIIAHGTAPATATAATIAGGTAMGSGRLIQPDRWFVMEVVATGGRLRVAIDNQLAVDYRDDDSPRTTGHIALQSFSEATEISFRKIEIQELRPSTDWTPLFNGEDLAGWQAIPPQHWKVEDGIIKGTGPASYLVTTHDDFEDFHLRAEYRINANGDSGVLFRIPALERDPTTPWGYKMLTGLEAAVSIRKAAAYRTGALTAQEPTFRVLAPATIAPHASDQWTRLEVIARQGDIQILVNGKLVTDYTDDERRFVRGHIALGSWEGATSDGQNIRTRVEFRKVEIRNLPARGTLVQDTTLPEGSSAVLLTSPDYEWTTPENLGPNINSAANDGGPTLSADGLTMIFHSTRPDEGAQGNSDLWMSTRESEDHPWTAPTNLGPNINTPALESAPALSGDGLTLVFDSDRPDRGKKRDLYWSRRSSTRDSWSPAVRMDDAINMKLMNSGPHLSADGLTLHFHTYSTSDDWGIFKTSRPSNDQSWSKPEQIAIDFEWAAYPTLATDELSMVVTAFPGGKLMLAVRGDTRQAWSHAIDLQPRISGGSPCLSANGNVLLFDTRDRIAGRGDFDIWMVRRVRKTAQTDGEQVADSAEVAALRELVSAKERDLEATKAQFTKGTITPLGVKPAEAELLEAKIRLAEAQSDQATVVARLKELVTVIAEEKSFTQQRIDAGVDPTSAINAVDARLADAKARLAKAEVARPAEE